MRMLPLCLLAAGLTAAEPELLPPPDPAPSGTEATSNVPAAAEPIPQVTPGPEPITTPGAQALDNAGVARLARERASAVAAAQSNVQASREDKRANLGIFYPQVSANGRYQYNVEESPATTIPIQPVSIPPQNITLPGTPSNQYAGNVRLDQNLFVFGRYGAVKRVAEAAIAATKASADSTDRDVSLRALIALETYRFAVATVGVTQARLNQRNDELANAEKRFKLETAPELDVRQARINAINAKDGVRAAVAEAEKAKAELAAAIRLPMDAFVISDGLSRPQDVNSLLSQAEQVIAGGADLRQLEAAVVVNQANAELELVNSRPTVGVFADYSTAGSRLNNLDDDFVVGIGVNWQLYDGGSRYARRRAALARAQAAEHQRDGTVVERQRELAVIQADLASLEARIALVESTIADSEANYADVKKLYQLGDVTLTRVGEVGLAVIEAQFNRNRYIFEEAILAHQLQAFLE